MIARTINSDWHTGMVFSKKLMLFIILSLPIYASQANEAGELTCFTFSDERNQTYNCLLEIGNHSTQHGPYLVFEKSGIILTSGYFKEGEPDGIWLTYNRNGSIHEVSIYKDGVLLKESTDKVNSDCESKGSITIELKSP